MRGARDLSLRTILLLAMVLLVFVPFVLIAVAWYAQTTAVIVGNVTSYAQEVLRQLESTLDTYFRQLQMRAFSAATSDAVAGFLVADSPGSYERYLMQQRMNREVFVNLAYDRPEVQNIGMVNEAGYAVAFQSHNDFMDTYHAVSSRLDAQPNRSFLLVGPWSPGSAGEVVSAVFVIRGPDRPRLRAVLIVDLSYGALRKFFDDVRVGPAGSLLVFDEAAALIYPDLLVAGGARLATAPRADSQEPSGSLTRRVEGSEQVVVYRRSALTGWTLQIQAHLSGLSGSLFALRRLTVFAMAGLLAILLAATSGVAFSVTRALRTLEHGIAEVERGNLSLLGLPRAGKELARIHEGYNRMVQRLRELIEVAHQAELREREVVILALESELLRIQSQINPHFLYNTLEVVNSYAIEAGSSAISRMIASLAAVARYSVSSPGELVPLGDELEHLGRYLDIQREVYPGLRAGLRVRGADRESVRLPRLTVQPLVENALVHGYEGHRRRVGYVGITGLRCDGRYDLIVRDKGHGMPEGVRGELEKLLSRPGTRHLTGGGVAPEILGARRVGLWNVHCRLRLAFGDPYGLRIERSDRQGTVVVVEVPGGGRG